MNASPFNQKPRPKTLIKGHALVGETLHKLHFDRTSDVLVGDENYPSFTIGALRRALMLNGLSLDTLPDDAEIAVRHYESGAITDRVFYNGRFQIDTKAKCVYIDGNQLTLAKREYRLLEYLAVNAGATLTITDILENSWPEGYADAGTPESTVRVHVKRIREKIDAKGIPGAAVIKNIRGAGYFFDPQADIAAEQDV